MTVPQTGSVQGLAYESANGTRVGVSTQISTSGKTTVNTNSPNFSYSFTNLASGSRAVTAIIPQGFSSAQWNACAPGLTGTCHDSAVWNPGRFANITIPAGNFVDLWFKFTRTSVATNCQCGLTPQYPVSERNFCFYPTNTPGCPMVASGGYCNNTTAGWNQGWVEYDQKCGH